MICEHCGMEHNISGFSSADDAVRALSECRDDLSVQLAEREAEFNALHVMWKNVSGALCDAETIVVYERDYARSVRELTAERDALKDQLASMTKRAEDAEREKTELLDTILTPEDYAKSSQDLWAQAVQADKERDVVEAKLATAVSGLQAIGRSDYFHAMRAVAEDTLRALGIDHAKEQEK